MANRTLEPGKYGPKIEYKGRLYSVQSEGGYYRNATTGKLLHREVWEDNFGPIPLGHEVHHKDGNRQNCDPGNLECLTRSEHTKRHPRGFAVFGTERRRRNSKRMWRDKPAKRFVCDGCGAEFESTCTRARWCGKVCSRRYHRAQEAAAAKARRIQSDG